MAAAGGIIVPYGVFARHLERLAAELSRLLLGRLRCIMTLLDCLGVISMQKLTRLLLLILIAALLVPILPTGAAGTEEPERGSVRVFTEEDAAILQDDVFAGIEAVKSSRAAACGGIEKLTEGDYASMIPQVRAAVEASETYVPGSLLQNGSFLVWETTLGLPCCYDPRLEAEIHSGAGMTAPAESACQALPPEELLSQVPVGRSGTPTSMLAGLIQPFWDSETNYSDPSFRTYSPCYLETWNKLNAYANNAGLRYTLTNATVDHIADAFQRCGLVMIDSHGTTDYAGANGDYTSRANCSYIGITTTVGITSADTKPQTGPYGTYYHAMQGSGYTLISGTCIANHMKSNAPHSLLYNGSCLGMATDGIYKSLRDKGVEVVWGYSQVVSFWGDAVYMETILGRLTRSDSLAEAVSRAKALYGSWDHTYQDYTPEECIANRVAFPICVSSEDAYPGRGKLDRVQTVRSAWHYYDDSVVVSGKCGENLTWSLRLTAGTFTVTGSGKMFSHAAEKDYIDFRDLVRSVTIADTVTDIGSYAFDGFPNLSRVQFGSGVSTIQINAFRGCTGLTQVRIPGNIAKISEGAFQDCTALTDLTLEEGVRYLRGSAFRNCKKLRAVTFPESLSLVDENAFDGCASLAAVQILRTGKTAFKTDAFVGCPIQRVDAASAKGWCASTFDNPAANPLYAAKKLYVNGTLLTALDFPKSVTVIHDYSFVNCASLTSVLIPEAVTAIGTDAFLGCSGLTDLYFAAGKTDMNQLLQGYRTASSQDVPGSVRRHYSVAKVNTHWVLEAENVGQTCTQDGVNRYRCACGFSRTETAPAAHIWDKGRVTVPPTETENGTRLYTCTRCGKTRTEQISNNPFSDVKQGKYYYRPVLWALYHDPQITSGTDASHFSPNGSCTRAQVVTFLWRAVGKPEPTAASNPFTDVKQDKYYYQAILWAVEQGITVGVDDTHFRPNQVCTRAQVMTFLWKARGKPKPAGTENPFVDVRSDKYFYHAVLWAVGAGVTKGVDPAHFCPGRTCTRAQVVTFLCNVLGAG